MTNNLTNWVFVINSTPLAVSVLSWDSQCWFFLKGFETGLICATTLASVWGVVRAIRGGGWFWDKE